VVTCWLGADGSCVWGIFCDISGKLIVVGDVHSAVEIHHICESTTLFEQLLFSHRNRLDKGPPNDVYEVCHCSELSKTT
jgi:hypothetical protein